MSYRIAFILAWLACTLSFSAAWGTACSTLDPDDFFDNLGGECREVGSPLPEETRVELTSGVLSFSVGTGADVIRSMVLQTDGRLVATGRSSSNTVNRFFALRFDIDGSLDPSFNGTGYVLTTLGTLDAIGHQILVETNGNLFVGGRSSGPVNYSYLVARFLSAGGFDTSFATLGWTRIAIGTSTDIVRGMSLGTDGSYSLGGYTWLNTGAVRYVASVSRLRSNSDFDTTFATQGKLILDFLTAPLGILATALDTAGRMVFGGTGESSNWQMVAGRLNSNGTLDTSFQTVGWVLISIGTGNDQFYSLKTYQDRILLAGSYHNGTNMDAALVRLNSDGTLDTSFGTTGKVARSFSTGDDFLYALSVDTVGTLVATGYGSRTDQDFLTVRYRSNGSLDTYFSTVGFLFTSVSNGNDQANALLVTNAGSVYAVGATQKTASTSSVGLARWDPTGQLASAGTFDLSFGTNGLSAITGGTSTTRGLAFTPDGRLTVGGQGDWLSSRARVARMMPDGSIDTSFNTIGYNQVPPDCGGCGIAIDWVELDSTGRAILFGWDSGAHLYMWRVLSGGALDTSFATIGYFTIASPQIYVYHGGVGTDGKLYAAGELSADSYVMRFSSNGTLDTSYMTTGKRRWTGGHELRVTWLDAQGRTLVAGAYSSFYPTVARFTSNGTFDTTFATQGFVHTTSPTYSMYFRGISEGPNGKIIASGVYSGGGGVGINRLFRYESNGVIDTTFGTAGYVDVSMDGGYAGSGAGYSMAQANNKAVLDIGRIGYIGYARLNSNGTIDTSFGTAGKLQRALGTYQGGKFRISNAGRICGTSSSNPGFTVVCFWP